MRIKRSGFASCAIRSCACKHLLTLEGAEFDCGPDGPAVGAEVFLDTGTVLREVEPLLSESGEASGALSSRALERERAKLEGKLAELIGK